MKSELPNTFVIGVPKAGTTSFTRYLGQHPDIFVPTDLEPNYFYLSTRSPERTEGPAPSGTIDHVLYPRSTGDLEQYLARYQDAVEPVRIDGSVRYLYHAAALEAIRDTCMARHVVILRDPAERIVSHWRMMRQYQLEPLPLLEALSAEDARIAAGWGYDWHYSRVSDYVPQLQRLFSLFPREDTHIVFYGDFVRAPVDILREAFRFCGVDPAFTVDRTQRGMVAMEYRSNRLARLVNWPGPVSRTIDALPGRTGRKLHRFIDRRNRRRPSPLGADTLSMLRSRLPHDDEELADLLEIPSRDLADRMSSQRSGS